MLRAMARLRSKLCPQGWQITGKGKSEGGLGDGNLGTARQSTVAKPTAWLSVHYEEVWAGLSTFFKSPAAQPKCGCVYLASALLVWE